MITRNWRYASPEQKNFWALCNGKIAWTTITSLYFQGAIAGSEFLTYNAGKLYIALELKFGAHANTGANPGTIEVYNEANAASFYMHNNTVHFNVAAQYTSNYMLIENIYFGRIASDNAVYDYFVFNGYRLNV
jgi:hypothetical protein